MQHNYGDDVIIYHDNTIGEREFATIKGVGLWFVSLEKSRRDRNLQNRTENHFYKCFSRCKELKNMNTFATSILLCCCFVGMPLSTSVTLNLQGLSELSSFIHTLKEASNEFATRSKRQVDPVTILQCNSAVLVTECDSGLSQGIANIYAQCGRNELAAVVANGCAKSDSGQPCTQGIIDTILSFRNILLYCIDNLLPNVSCSSQCRTALETIQSELGCCINAFYNDTRISSTFIPYFTDLWWKCGLEDVGTCSNIPSFVPGTRFPPCSDSSAFQSALSYKCTQTRLQQVLNALAEAGDKCQYLVESNVNACAQRCNGNFCGVNTLVNSTAIIDLRYAISICTDSLFCSSNCKSALNSVRTSSGCCLNNLYNSSSPLQVTSYELWNRCGVVSPGFCPNMATAGASTYESSVFIVVAMVITGFKLIFS